MKGNEQWWIVTQSEAPQTTPAGVSAFVRTEGGRIVEVRGSAQWNALMRELQLELLTRGTDPGTWH